MTGSREDHLKIAAEQRRLGLDAFAAVHERQADRLERADYEVRTTLDLPDGEQVDVDVGFDIEPGERATWGHAGGSPAIPASVVVVWVERLDCTPVDFDTLTLDQQRQITAACWHELDGRNR